MYKVLVQVCVVCCATPPGPPLYGCEAGHLVCLGCRQVNTSCYNIMMTNHIIHGIQMGGALLSCPRCGSTQLDTRQTVAEELLEHELDRTRLVFCPYKVTTSLNNCTSLHAFSNSFALFSLWAAARSPVPS